MEYVRLTVLHFCCSCFLEIAFKGKFSFSSWTLFSSPLCIIPCRSEISPKYSIWLFMGVKKKHKYLDKICWISTNHGVISPVTPVCSVLQTIASPKIPPTQLSNPSLWEATSPLRTEVILFLLLTCCYVNRKCKLRWLAGLVSLYDLSIGYKLFQIYSGRL